MTDPTQSDPEQTPTWKLTLSYDGTDFHGWQVQPGESTIQGELQSALGRIVSETPLPQGSGRTDAGVHALAQVASFALRARIPPANLIRALNRTLPQSIRVIGAELVPSTFHARHSAVAKTYEYRVLPIEPASAQICPPFLSRYVCPYSWRIDFDRLQRAAAQFLGEHDFASFAASDPDFTTRRQESVEAVSAPAESDPADRRVVLTDMESTPAPRGNFINRPQLRSTIRTIYSSSWHQHTTENLDLLVYRVRGNGFLHHMVRNLVGTMLDVARGYRLADDIPAILSARDRSLAGPTAPALGLFLHSVEYQD